MEIRKEEGGKEGCKSTRFTRVRMVRVYQEEPFVQTCYLLLSNLSLLILSSAFAANTCTRSYTSVHDLLCHISLIPLITIILLKYPQDP